MRLHSNRIKIEIQINCIFSFRIVRKSHLNLCRFSFVFFHYVAWFCFCIFFSFYFCHPFKHFVIVGLSFTLKTNKTFSCVFNQKRFLWAFFLLLSISTKTIARFFFVSHFQDFSIGINGYFEEKKIQMLPTQRKYLSARCVPCNLNKFLRKDVKYMDQT